MFRLFITIALLLFCTQTFFAQKAPFKFGDVAPKHFQIDIGEKYENEKAIILGDWGHTSINGVDVIFKRHRRILILSEEGLDYADLDFTYGNKLSVGKVKGATYNLVEGKVNNTKLAKDDVITEKLEDGLRRRKIAFPEVRPGTIVEYKYTLHIEKGAYSLKSWAFQHDVPCLYSEYLLWLPSYFKYKTLMHGYITLDHATPAGRPIHQGEKYELKYVAKNVPPFKEEPYMTCTEDYLSYIEFELNEITIPGYEQIISGQKEDLRAAILNDEDFIPYMNGNGFLKSVLQELMDGKDNEYDQLLAIHNYVKNNFEWDKKLRKYPSNRPRQVFKEKKGNSAEINMLMLALLRETGIKASPVLLSTRKNGKQTPYFLLAKRYNYTICRAQVDGKTYLLDATSPHLGIGILPVRCLNGEGLLVDENKPATLIPLQSNTKTFRSVNITMELSDDGELMGELNSTLNGYYALRARAKAFEEIEKVEAKEVVDDEEEEIEESYEMNVIDYDIKNLTNCEESFIESAEIKVTGAVQDAGKVIYIDPILMAKINENPFKLENRIYPVDFAYPFQTMYTMTLKIPEGYQISDLPEKTAVALPNKAGIFQYDVTALGDQLRILNRLSINKREFVSTEYPYLKEFYDIIVAKQGEQLVLKKMD